jgi:hypothetical protein
MTRKRSAAAPPTVPPTIAPTSVDFELELELLGDGLEPEPLDDDEAPGVMLELSGPDQQQ